MSSRTTRRLWIVVAVVVVLLLAKFFVADFYRIDSDSMRPTLFGGEEGEPITEWALVGYERVLTPERFDLVVARTQASDRPIVKRAAGLPGERVRIEGGDLLIDGERLPADVPRPEPVLVFDDRLFEVAEAFAPELAPEGPWIQVDESWLLDGHRVASGSNQGMMFFQRPLRDDHILPSGLLVEGKRQVNDAILEVDFLLEEPLVDRLRFVLNEEGDSFEAHLESHPYDAGSYVLRLRWDEAPKNAQAGALSQGNVRLECDTWYTLRLANVDNHLRAEIPQANIVLIHDYAANTPHPTAQALGQAEHGQRSFGDRVAFGGEGCRVRFGKIRVLRDLYYTDVDQYGTRGEVILGANEVFLLGDNSAHSKDSRSFGPVPLGDLLGRPLAVVWPLTRLRWLGH